MKITRNQLRRLIKEELSRALFEQEGPQYQPAGSHFELLRRADAGMGGERGAITTPSAPTEAELMRGERGGTGVEPVEPGRMDVSDQIAGVGNYVVEISGAGESAVAYITDIKGNTVSGGVNWNTAARPNLGMLQIRDAIDDHRVTRRWDRHWAPA